MPLLLAFNWRRTSACARFLLRTRRVTSASEKPVSTSLFAWRALLCSHSPSLASHLLVASLRLRALPDALLGRAEYFLSLVALAIVSPSMFGSLSVHGWRRSNAAPSGDSERRRRHTTPHRQPRVETVGALDDVDELERDSARAALVALAPHEQQVHARQRVGVTQLTVALWCLALLDREAKLIELVAHKL